MDLELKRRPLQRRDAQSPLYDQMLSAAVGPSPIWLLGGGSNMDG